MNLKEAIKHCYEVAEEQEQKAKALTGDVLTGDFCKARREACIKCALEHRQLAEWLEELDGYRKAHEMIKKLPNANPSYWHSCDVIDRADCLAIIDECIEVKNETDN